MAPDCLSSRLKESTQLSTPLSPSEGHLGYCHDNSNWGNFIVVTLFIQLASPPQPPPRSYFHFWAGVGEQVAKTRNSFVAVTTHPVKGGLRGIAFAGRAEIGTQRWAPSDPGRLALTNGGATLHLAADSNYWCNYGAMGAPSTG